MLSQKFLKGAVEKSDVVGRKQQPRCAFGERENLNALPVACWVGEVWLKLPSRCGVAHLISYLIRSLNKDPQNLEPLQRGTCHRVSQLYS